MLNKRSGFSLVELLVVITIIGLLLGFATISYANFQQKGRDAKRKADLRATQQALEQFYADNGAYPDEGPDDHISCSTIVNSGSSNWVPGDYGRNGIPSSWRMYEGASFNCPNLSKTYMSFIPKDPIGSCWNKPAESPPTDPCNPDNVGSHPDGYIYEVKQTSSNGWCKTTDGGMCKKYALFARLENTKDPDKYVTGKDATCDDLFNSTSAQDNRWHKDTNGVEASATWYCVHSPN